MDREALLSAARVCREVATDGSLRPGMEAMPALYCEERILALAEQQTNDLRGAAALGNVPQADHGLVVGTPFDSASRPCTEAQSAPHPDPAETAMPVCEAHIRTWFTERDQLAGGLSADCIVCAHGSQSAPHPDPAGQQPVAWRYRYRDGGKWHLAGSRDECNTLPEYEQQPLYAAPAEPGPETVSVPREPTNAMIDAPRQIILYAETPGRTLEGLRAHLERSGVDYLAWFPVWATRECGHLTKAGIAILVYRAMLAAGSANSKEQR